MTIAYGPAFPTETVINNKIQWTGGMTMRQYYKAAALQGYISKYGIHIPGQMMSELISSLADEMIKEDQTSKNMGSPLSQKGRTKSP